MTIGSREPSFQTGYSCSSCGDGRDEHRVLDQRCAQIERDVQQAADDHQRRDVGQEHGQPHAGCPAAARARSGTLPSNS